MAGKNGNRMVPKRGEPLGLAEEQHTAQAKLRTAVFNAVSEGDVTEVVKNIVEKAKEGDRVALKYLFDYILGGRVTTAIQNNVYIDGRLDPAEPTDAAPGSAEKIAALAARVAGGRQAFHAEDA